MHVPRNRLNNSKLALYLVAWWIGEPPKEAFEQLEVVHVFDRMMAPFTPKGHPKAASEQFKLFHAFHRTMARCTSKDSIYISRSCASPWLDQRV